MTFESFDPATAVGDIVSALERDGVAIIRDIATPETIDRLLADIEPALAEQEPGSGEFFGYRAKRVGGIVSRSPVFAELIVDPLLLGLADAVLLPNCETYQIQLSGLLQVWKGGKPQPLHRDTVGYDPYLTLRPGTPEILLSMIWAVSDFTAENGATRLARGSQLWEPARKATDADIVQAVMPKGSVAVWLGAVLHGMAVNYTDTPRAGMVSGYSVGWLRQEENQYVVCPPDAAAALPEKVQQLIGYKAHSPRLGWVEGRDTELLLRPGDREFQSYVDQPFVDTRS